MVALITLQHEMVLKVLQGQISGGIRNLIKPSRRNPSNSLHFNFTETSWKTGVQEPVLLLERSKEYRNPQDSEQNLGIIAIARCIGYMRNADGSRPIEVSNWTVLPEGIALYEVTQRMNPPRARLLWSSFDDVTRPLSERLDAELRDALLDFIPNYDSILQDKRSDPGRSRQVPTDDELLEAERQDRLGTVLRMSGITDRRQAQAYIPRELPAHVQRFEYDLTEPDMLDDDVARVPGWQTVGPPIGGWHEYYNDGKRLLVKNINFKWAEQHSGGDIIYVRDKPSTILFVQYKRLITEKKIQKYDSVERLYNQLSKIISLQEEARSSDECAAVTGESYRLSNIPGFVKFVEARPPKPIGDDLLRGYYYPAPYYHALLQKLADNGDLHGKGVFTPDRYIDSQTFIRLASDGWIGSRSEASMKIAKKLGAILRDSNSGETTLAMEVNDDQ